jgi:hypothetical protein
VRALAQLGLSLLDLHLQHGGVLVHLPHFLLVTLLHCLQVSLELLVLLF